MLQGIKPTSKIVNEMKRYIGSFHSFFDPTPTSIACVVFLGFLSHNTPKKISESEMSNKTDIAFSGCGFMGIYYVGVTNCIDTIAPDLLQQRIGGTSAGGPKKLFFSFLTFWTQVHFRVCP